MGKARRRKEAERRCCCPLPWPPSFARGGRTPSNTRALATTTGHCPFAVFMTSQTGLDTPHVMSHFHYPGIRYWQLPGHVRTGWGLSKWRNVVVDGPVFARWKKRFCLLSKLKLPIYRAVRLKRKLWSAKKKRYSLQWGPHAAKCGQAHTQQMQMRSCRAPHTVQQDASFAVQRRRRLPTAIERVEPYRFPHRRWRGEMPDCWFNLKVKTRSSVLTQKTRAANKTTALTRNDSTPVLDKRPRLCISQRSRTRPQPDRPFHAQRRAVNRKF